MTASNPDTLYKGRFLNLMQTGQWEYVTRIGSSGVVAIVALHDDGRIVLVEQLRPAVGGRVIELPAGLAGDVDEDESLLVAAKRELEEETGYSASQWRRLFTGYSSAGLTDEAVTFFLATGLARTGPGGGDDKEDIRVHEVPVDVLMDWIKQWDQAGGHVDAKLYSGVYAGLALFKKDAEDGAGKDKESQ